MKSLVKVSDREIYQWWLNAMKTYYGALGHNKSSMNQFYARHYKEELDNRGSKLGDKCVPKFNESGNFIGDLKTEAIFNGEGSY